MVKGKQIKYVNLEALPNQWNQLTDKQLIGIHKLLHKKYNEYEYKVRVLLLLMGLKICAQAQKEEDGTFTYIFRRRGFIPWLTRERIGMQSWEVDYWIGKYLGFLDNPFTLTRLPWENLRIEGVSFRAPEPLLLSLTYQQYGNAQRCLVNYWQQRKMVEAMLDNGSSQKAVRRAIKEEVRMRAEFLSHLFVAPKKQLTEEKDGVVIRKRKVIYPYSSDSAKDHIRHFLSCPAWLFDICYQYFQTSLMHYHQFFPNLFKEYDENDETSTKNPLVMELEMVNVLKRECNYQSQQAVYDTNAAFIFEDLNSMATKAKQIEEMNAKMRLTKR